jgi:TonB-linked SusC/RagA family outer membrane protein
MTENNSSFKSSPIVKFFICSLFALLCSFSSYGQGVIKGVITDGKGEALPGVSVVVKGSNNRTITNLDGQYSVQATGKDILVLSYIGLVSQEVGIAGRTTVNVTMQDDVAALDEVVVVAYGTQKRASITGAISSISGDEILKAPTMSVSNMIGSRVAGVIAVQSSGQPGEDNASLTVRGMDAIYVIDGFKRSYADFNGLDPNEIESVSVLKDASAVAIYGLGANAAIIVTTKKGKREKMNIVYTGSYGVSQNAVQQQWLDGPGYAYWYNKARELDGDTPIFTSEMVQKMKDGVDGWGNTNWYDEIMGTGTRQHHNVSAQGGSERVRFFTSIGYLEEKGNIDNFNYNRMNLRSNVEANLTKSLTMTLGVSGRIEKRDTPRYTADPNGWHNIAQQVIRAHPYVPTTMERDGQSYYVSTPTASSAVNPLASINESGYSKTHRSYIQSEFSLKYDAPWLKGLSAKFQGSYDLTYNFGKTLSKPFTALQAVAPNANTTSLTYVLVPDPGASVATLSESAARAYDYNVQTSVSYNNTFGKHNVSAMALAEIRENRSNALSAAGSGLDFIQLDELGKITNQTATGEKKEPTIGGYSGMTRVAGFVGRINYSYDDKYLVEASIRHDGSYVYGGMNDRWVTLPGLSLGWRINNEEWFDMPFVNNLKLRAGIGKTATTSGLGAFQWLNTMGTTSKQAVIGGNPQSIIYASVLGNSTLRWDQNLQYNLGFDATLWNGLLGVEFDVFYKYRWDILGSIAGSYPPSIGGYYFSTANVNKQDYKGFDLTLTHRNKILDFSYGAKLIWSYTYGRWLKYVGDGENMPDYNKYTGKQIGLKRGFIAQGLFQTADEIANSPTIEGSAVLPGYIKYVDRNGDGVITYAQDMGFVGKSSIPTNTGSLNLFGEWKGFDFDLLFGWGLGHSVALTGIYTAEGSVGVMDNTAYTKPFYHGGNSPAYVVENSWTPDNPDGELPRLSLVTVSSNNAYSSTFWYRNGDYLRMKTAQVGYNFPKKWLVQTGIEGVRIYAEGYNLFTLSGLNKYNIDPESPAVNNGYYPQQRTYSLGVKLTF